MAPRHDNDGNKDNEGGENIEAGKANQQGYSIFVCSLHIEGENGDNSNEGTEGTLTQSPSHSAVNLNTLEAAWR
jgi:hypothetical protein